MVRLKATDSSGADSATVTVVITVTDVNEEPTFGIDGADGGIAGMAPDHREDSLDADDMVDLTISTYTASDPEEGDVTLSLTGDDAGMFELAPDSIPGLNASRVLSFKAKPDFEMPGDSNSDNIYEVTVVASDGVNTDTRSVTVKVTDADEGGKVTLWSQDALTQDALIGVELTATLADSDGGVPDEDRFMRQAWEWQKATPDQGDTCEDTNAGENATWAEAGSGSTYTPKAGDRGDCLRAMVTYTDRTRDTDNMPENNVADPDGNPATDDAFVGFTNTAMSDATTQVRNNPMNQAPEFADGATTFRLVEENTKALSGTADDDATDDNPADNVGGLPVMATDDNDGDTVAYTLGGLDKDMFRVRANGQLEVSAKANLDHETKSSHTITLTATDSSNTVNDSATITVTIYVTDLDERPVIASRASAPGENNAPRFRVATTGRSVEENTAVGMPIGDPVTANDADNDTLTYELGGADRASFDINTDTGQLMTSAMLDYETKASYSVTVTASDGTDTDTITVTITITDVVVEDTTPVTDGTLLERYAGDDGILQRGEVIDAIDDYLDAGDGAPSRGDVIELIDLYLDSGS